MLEELQLQRYSRQLLLPEIGGAGQERLLAARVEVRCGGPGGDTLRAYLAAAGVAEGVGGLVIAGPEEAAGASWVLDEVGIAWAGTTGGPCGDCLAATLTAIPRPPEWARGTAAQIAGALGATQLLLALAGRSPAAPGAYFAWPHADHRRISSRIGCRCA